MDAHQLGYSLVLFFDVLMFSGDDWDEIDGTQNTNVIDRVNNSLLVKGLSEYKGYVYVIRQDMLQETGIWRMVQVDTALRLGLDLFFATDTCVISCRYQFPGQSGYIFGSFNPRLCRVMMHVDVRKSYRGTINQSSKET